MSDQISAKQRIERFWADPSGTVGSPIGQTGYALPDITGHEWRALGDESSDNWLLAPAGVQPRFTGDVSGRGNVVVVGNDCTLNLSVGLQNQDATIIIGERTGAHGGGTAVFGNATDGIVFIGAGTTCNSAALFLLGDKARIIIGEDCMFAHGIVLRTNDDHAMIDMETGRQLNPTGDILMEPHVWVCPETTILRNARIGMGSVVGTKSVVGGTYSRFTLVAGAPARAVRSGVSWDRPQQARPNQYLLLKALDHTIPSGWDVRP